MPDKPNILFIFTDDQRFDAVGAMGNDVCQTPYMDSLMRNGVMFTQATIMGSTCPAVCCPSRSMLMSGRTLWHTPRDLGDWMTFPQLLQQHGYNTFGTGKWHNEPPSYARSFSDGAKIFFGGMSNHLEVPVQDFDPSGEYDEDRIYIGEKFSTELFCDATCSFLREYDDDSPFLAYLSTTAPHDPRMPPKKYDEMYDPDDIPVPENFMPRHPFDNGEMEIRDEKLAPWPRTPSIIREHIADYYGMITHLDDEIGRVLETLEQTGRADNTIIIFAGDNGLAVGQHGLMGKQNMYDHSVRVPLAMVGPGLPQAETSDAQCYLLDIFPTLCDLLDIEPPDSVEGESLMPVIEGTQTAIRDNLMFAYMDCQRAVRDRRFKLIEYYVDGERTTQLFDTVRDPWEMDNLVEDPEYGEQLDYLRGELQRWQREVDDPMVAG